MGVQILSNGRLFGGVTQNCDYHIGYGHEEIILENLIYMDEQVIEEDRDCHQACENFKRTLLKGGIKIDPEITGNLKTDITTINADHICTERGALCTILSHGWLHVHTLNEAIAQILPVGLIVLEQFDVAREVPQS